MLVVVEVKVAKIKNGEKNIKLDNYQANNYQSLIYFYIIKLPLSMAHKSHLSEMLTELLIKIQQHKNLVLVI